MLLAIALRPKSGDSEIAMARTGRYHARVLNLNPDARLAGVLAPVFSLRGENDLGIGDTASLKEFISWSASHGLKVVQILPVNETGNDHSPYNLLSAMALDPSTVATSPKHLEDLTEEDFSRITSSVDLDSLRSGPVRYGEVKVLKTDLLRAAFATFRSRKATPRTRAFAKFERENKSWLEDYSLHRALVNFHGESEVSTHWPTEHQSPSAAREWLAALPAKDRKALKEEMRFRAYVQWIAYSQWGEARQHAEALDVALMGDVPVGVSIFSSDVWQNPGIFDLTRSSGAPPEKVFKSDPFTEKWGQNWGFPLYDWPEMAKDDFRWWRLRMRLMMSLFHLLRVDHALGFFRIYSFPWRPEENELFTPLTPEDAAAITGGRLPGFVDHDDDTEEHREHNRRHGEMIFEMLLSETKAHRLIAEDLGEVAPYVRPSLMRMEIPGFKIPQWERTWDRLTPGAEYQRLSLATYATHDHPPLKAMWDDLVTHAASEDQNLREAAIHSLWELMNFCGHPDIKLPQTYTPEIHGILLKGLFQSNSWLAVHMVTDIFGIDLRFNVPGSTGDQNWRERIPGEISTWNEGWAGPLQILKEALIDTER